MAATPFKKVRRFKSKLIWAAAFLVTSAGSADSQVTSPASNAPPVENVTVSADKTVTDADVTKFIESFAAPTQVLGKLARWDVGVCPVAVGLRPEAIKFILQRLRDNAAKVGAPVNDRADCRPNIEIVFTTTPQGLLDNVRKEHAMYLGYTNRSADADKLAIVTHTIQAWYTTATKDIMGVAKVDSLRTIGLGDSDDLAFALGSGSVSGFRMHDGRETTLFHVIIAINPIKLGDHEIGGLADYISFLALSQLASLDRCQELSSIINMLVPGCGNAAKEMSTNDVAFLRGLYKMTLDGDLRMQEDGINHEMKEAFRGR